MICLHAGHTVLMAFSRGHLPKKTVILVQFLCPIIPTAYSTIVRPILQSWVKLSRVTLAEPRGFVCTFASENWIFGEFRWQYPYLDHHWSLQSWAKLSKVKQSNFGVPQGFLAPRMLQFHWFLVTLKAHTYRRLTCQNRAKLSKVEQSNEYYSWPGVTRTNFVFSKS